MTDFSDVLADFRAAVAALTDSMQVTDPRGHTGTVGSLVEQIIEGRPPVSDDSFASSGFESKPPVWVAGMDWLGGVEIPLRYTATSNGLQVPPRLGVADMLGWATRAEWPDSSWDQLVKLTGIFRRLRGEGLRLLYPELFTLDAPCPECGSSHVISGIESGHAIKRPALVVRELFAECAACSEEWWGVDIVRLAHRVELESALTV